MEQAGVVDKITDDVLFIKTEDGNVEGIPIGTLHGSAGGLTIPHKVITDLSVGDKVKAGDIVAWNTNFFERDWLNPRNVTYKVGCLANVAFMEGNGTLEDASLINLKLAEDLTSSVTKEKVIVVDADDHVLKLVKIGDEVESDSLLCLIQDAAVNENDIDDEALSALSRFSERAPKAKVSGKVTKIEVIYHVDKAEMSSSIKSIAEASDRRLAKKAREVEADSVITGRITSDTFLGGEKVEPGQVAIRIMIDQDLGVVVGDKAVLASQLKTVISGIMLGTNRIKGGDDIDMIFGWRSVMDRIVVSAEIMGISIAVLQELTKQAAKMYFEE